MFNWPNLGYRTRYQASQNFFNYHNSNAFVIVMFDICRRQFGIARTHLITASHYTTWRSLATPIQSDHIPLFILWQTNRMTKWLAVDTPKLLFPFLQSVSTTQRTH
jgi:hypothetical protein